MWCGWWDRVGWHHSDDDHDTRVSQSETRSREKLSFQQEVTCSHRRSCQTQKLGLRTSAGNLEKMTTDLRNQFDQRTPEIMSYHWTNLGNKVKEPQKSIMSEDPKICEPQAVRSHPKPQANKILAHCSPKVNFLRLNFQPNTLRTNTSLSGQGAAKKFALPGSNNFLWCQRDSCFWQWLSTIHHLTEKRPHQYNSPWML